MPSILLIDDQEQALAELESAIRRQLSEHEGRILRWLPDPHGRPAIEQWREHVSGDVALVVTDYDLSRGQFGLLGDSVLRWCQQEAIPAALYSRGNYATLPTVPDLFELNVHISEPDIGRTIVDIFRGFVAIDAGVQGIELDDCYRNPAAVLARVLDHPELEYEFAQYTVRLGSAGGALFGRLQSTHVAGAGTKPPNGAPQQEGHTAEVRRLLTYVVGHLMVNAVLPYPGPLLTMAALCGYIGTSLEEAATLSKHFAKARYAGPFGTSHEIYWRFEVDSILAKAYPADTSLSEYTARRAAVEALEGRALAHHTCPRCGGVNGGFFCPFTKRAVCQREDCSVASNSWLPPGASACRIEADFFEEWAPLLGY
ncbi:MAG TPA: hypothetical protein VJU82_16780 [Acidobacteriaceae bacterium]|nr:hypothetical protein [Acidobacteriaceae bacterium]